MIKPKHAQLEALRGAIRQHERNEAQDVALADQEVRDAKVDAEAARLVRLAENLNVGGIAPPADPEPEEPLFGQGESSDPDA